MRIEDMYYSQNVQTNNYAYVNSKNAEAVTSEQAKDSTSTAKASDKVNADRAEFSKDTKVTGKMSDADRASLVQSLKADMDNQMARFTNMMAQMFQKQGITGLSAQDNSLWRQIASGNFTVDAQTKADAQAAISEDGYWGVKQTSQRIFDFAYALAGDDVEKMKEMQAAVEKGYKQAGAAWGGALPSISGQTYSAIGDLFNEYYEKAGKAE